MLELTDDVRQGLAKTAGHGALSFNTEEYAKAIDLKNSADDRFNVRGLPGGTFGQSVIDSTLGVAGNIDDFFGGPTGLGDYANNYVTAQEMAMGEKPEADFSWDYFINGLPRDTGNLIGSGISLAAPIAAATLAAPFVGVGATAAGIGGALAGAGLESMAEGGQKMRDSLANGDSLETAQDKARTVAGENMALLAPTNILGLGALKKVGQGLKTAYNGGKAVSATGGALANYPKLSQAVDFAKGAGWAGLGAMNEGAQEAWQQGIQDSVEPDTDWGILPWNWNDEQAEAFKSTIGPTALMAGVGGGARLAARKLGASDVPQGDLGIQANNNLFGAGTAEISTQGADIDEQVAHLKDGYQSVIPQVAGVLVNDFGIEGAQISSGFRTREHNKEVGGAENSYHVGDGEHGDALDIVLPDGTSAETAEAIKQRFKNSGVFDEVLFHDAGSGYHLHLGGLKTENIGNSYGSYSGNADVDSAINEMAEKYNLDPALLAAMAEQESGFNQSAQSEAGAMGIMQLMPGTAEGLGVDPSDLRGNLEGGAKYLRQMLDKYDGDVEKALAAYNAGPGSLDSVNGDISKLSGETQKYVPSVMERYNKFKNKSGGGISSSGNILDWDSTNEDFSKLDFFPKDGEQSQGTANEFLENLAKLEESDDQATKEKGRQAQDILQQYGDDTEKLTEKAKELGYQQIVNPAEVHGRIPMRRIVSTALNNGQVTFATKKAADIFASSPIGQTMERQGKTFKVTDNFKMNEQVNAISQQVNAQKQPATKTVQNTVKPDVAVPVPTPLKPEKGTSNNGFAVNLLNALMNIPEAMISKTGTRINPDAVRRYIQNNDLPAMNKVISAMYRNVQEHGGKNKNVFKDVYRESATAVLETLLNTPEALTSTNGARIAPDKVREYMQNGNIPLMTRAINAMSQNLREHGIEPQFSTRANENQLNSQERAPEGAPQMAENNGVTEDSYRARQPEYSNESESKESAGTNNGNQTNSQANKNTEMELADGYSTESGKPLNEANEREFIVKPDGSKDFGEISSDISKAVKEQSGIELSPGKIRLRVGNEKQGLIHAKKHEQQAKTDGYSSIEDMIADVASNFNEIYLRTPRKAGDKPTYSLVKLGDKNTGKKNGTAPVYFDLQSDGNGQYYIVITAIPKGDKSLKRQTKKDHLIYSSPGLDAATTSNGSAVSRSISNNVGAEQNVLPTSDKSSGFSNSTIPQNQNKGNENPNASNEPMRKALIERAAANEDTWVNSKKSELHLEDDNDTVVKLTPQELKYYQDLVRKGVVAKPELYEESQEDVGEMDDNVEMSKEQKQLYDESNGDRDVPESDSESSTNGKSTKVVTADGKEYNVHYEVRPESKITASNNLDGSVNKDYPSELQPRNRQRVVNLTQVAEIAGNLRPADLAENRMLNHGAPLIREDGVVLNGNGRIMAIRTAVKNGTDHGYKQYLIDHAEELGLNPDNIEHMENPVLVKVVDDDLTADDVKAITTDTSGGQRMSASEQAKTDAKKIKPSTLNMYRPNESGELMGNNKYFLGKLLEDILPADERNAYYTEDGSISKDGLMRAQRALFALAYGNDKLIDTFAETTNEQAKNLINALNANAATIAKLQRMIENGNAHDLKLRDNLVNAINALRSAVLDGKPAERIWKETSMFEEAELTPETKALAKAMDGFRKSGKKLTNFIAQLADNNLRHGDPKQETMFDGADDFSLMKDIASAEDKIANGGQANIFEAEDIKRSRINVHSAESLKENGNSNTELDRLPKVPIAKLRQSEQKIVRFGKAIGVPVHFVESSDTTNRGVFTHNGEIFINRKAKVPAHSIFVHEFVHWLKASPENAGAYDVLNACLENSSGLFNEARINKYRNKIFDGEKMTDEEIVEEIICDAMTQTESAEKLMRAVNNVDGGLVTRIAGCLKAMWDKFCKYMNFKQHKMSNEQHLPNELSVAEFQRADIAFNKILMNLKNDNGEPVFHRVGTELLLRENNAKPVDTYQIKPISYTYAVAYSKENKDKEPIEGNNNQQDNENEPKESELERKIRERIENSHVPKVLEAIEKQYGKHVSDFVDSVFPDKTALLAMVDEVKEAINSIADDSYRTNRYLQDEVLDNLVKQDYAKLQYAAGDVPPYMKRMQGKLLGRIIFVEEAFNYGYDTIRGQNDYGAGSLHTGRQNVHEGQNIEPRNANQNLQPAVGHTNGQNGQGTISGKKRLDDLTTHGKLKAKWISELVPKPKESRMKHSTQGAFSSGNKYSRGVDLSPSTDGVAIAARANNNLLANMKGLAKKANAKFNPFHHEELENLRIDKRDKEKDLNLIEYQFVSPTRESKKYKVIHPFVMKGKQAMAKQEKLRFEFNEGMNELDKLLGWREGFHRNDPKFKERKEALNEILLKGDLERKEFTNEELIKAGYDAETIKGYHKMRALLDKAWKLADETKSRIKYQSITSSTQRRAEADFADLKDKNPFAEIISKVHNPDGTVTINYKAPHVRRVDKQTVLPSELENLRKNKDVHIVETTQSLKGTTQVTYYQREAGMGKLKGYIPHIFHGWYVCKVDKDGKAIVDDDGNVALDNIMTTANSLSEAAKLGRELAKANPNANYRVIPQMFSAPGAHEQAIIMGDFDYAKVVGQVADSMSMSISDAQAMLDNTIKMKNRGRFYGYAKQRKGFKGFEQNVYLATMKYFNQTARYAAMDSFKRDSISMYNRIFGAFDDENVTKRSAMAKWTKQYISDMNGTPTWIEKMINNTLHNFGLGEERAGGRPALWLQQKIFTYPMTILKLGVFNPSSALLNLTQLFNLYGAMGEKVLSPQAYQRLLHKGFADTFRAMSNKDSELGKLLWKELGLDYQIGMDIASGYSNAEVSNLASLRGFAGRLAGKSMYLFRQSDAFARGVTLLTAYNKALDEGKSKAEAIEYAKEINDKVNFDYSVADEPTIFRALGPISKVFLQFKKYPVKQLELFQDFYLDGRELGLNRKQAALRTLKYMAPYMAMSGMMGIPFISLAGGLLSALVAIATGDDDWDWEKKIKQYMITEFGEDSPITQWWLYGAGSFIGLNLGSRVGMGDFLGPDSYNSADGLLGLAVNQTTLGSTIQQVSKQLSYRNYAEALKAINPTIGNIALAYKGEVRTTRGRMKYQYQNMAERMWRAIGFTPLNETLAGDLASNEYAEKQEQTKAKQKAVDDFLANPSSENAARLNELGVTPKSLENESARRTMNRHQLNELAKEKEATKKKKKPKTYSASDYLKAVQ